MGAQTIIKAQKAQPIAQDKAVNPLKNLKTPSILVISRQRGSIQQVNRIPNNDDPSPKYSSQKSPKIPKIAFVSRAITSPSRRLKREINWIKKIQPKMDSHASGKSGIRLKPKRKTERRMLITVFIELSYCGERLVSLYSKRPIMYLM